MLKQKRWLFYLLLVALLVPAWMVSAQPECGGADSIDYPVDTRIFKVTQDYGVPSPRHQGRYHTGEDWYGERGSTLGAEVRAAATGLVTVASPGAWGRDGGVIILRHDFNDGTTAYTQYGHITQSDSVQFPAPFACVQQGEVIAVIADVRPAPHLHFEVRASDGDNPGPGYTWDAPNAIGWRDPSDFITTMQSRLNAASRWRIPLTDQIGGLPTPPLVLDDNSLIYFDGTTARRATPDGRVMWRLTLPETPVGITGFRGLPLATYADGTMQFIALGGALGENWQTNETLRGFPLVTDDLLIFPTDNQAVIAFDRERRNVVWRLDNIPAPLRWHQADNGLIGIVTQTRELFVLSAEGQLLDQARLREPASLTTGTEGTLLVYSRGGLWTVDAAGIWSPMMENVPRGGTRGAITRTAEGLFILFDGGTLYAYTADGALLWQESISDISGQVELADYGSALLLVSGTGDVVVINKAGGACNRLQFAADERARLWHNLGTDGILRVATGGQIIGIDWARFTRVCNP